MGLNILRREPKFYYFWIARSTMKRLIRTFLHSLLLPRGKQYVYDDMLHNGWESISIEVSDNILVALHGDPNGSPTGIVILAHPYLSEASQFFLRNGHAEMYRKQGLAVFIPDFNGFGRSPFRGFDYIGDLECVIMRANQMYPVLPVFIHGISFGASHTVGFAARHKNLISGIVIENCLDSNLTYYKKRNYRLFLMMKGIMYCFPAINKNHDYIRSASMIDPYLRALLIYNREDTLTTTQMGYGISRALKCKYNMVVMPGIHLKARTENPYLYDYTIARFISVSTETTKPAGLTAERNN